MKKEYRLQAVLFAGCILAAALLSQRLYIRIDTTQAQTYSLSRYTKKLLDGLDNTLTITWFRSHTVDGILPSLQYMESLLHEYRQYAPERCRIVQKDSAGISERELAGLGLIPRQFERTTGTKRITEQLYSGLLCEYGGQRRVIPFIADVQLLEADIARFITEMTQDIQGRSTDRSVYVLMPPETGTAQYKYVLPWLEYGGFKPVLPPFTALNPEIPLLVIGSSYIEAGQLAAIDVFLQRKGNAAFFVSANTVDIQGNWRAVPKKEDSISALLERFGFFFQQNLIIDPVNFRMKLPSPEHGAYEPVNYPFWPTVFYRNEYPLQYGNTAAPPLMPEGTALQFFWPSELVLTDTAERRTDPLVLSSPHSILQNPPYDTDPYGKQLKGLASHKQAAAVIAGLSLPVSGNGEAAGDSRNAAMQRGKIFAAADEYCVSTAVEYTNSDVNLDFMLNTLYLITGQDALLQLRTKQPAVFPFRYIENEETFLRIALISRIVNLIAVPLLLIAGGIAVMVKRRRT